jgi:DNA ligase-associated metallophosphoesterase
MKQTRARRIVLLGDLLHSRTGMQPATNLAIAAWRKTHRDVEFRLIRGNHDRQAGDPPAAWNIAADNEPIVDSPFVFRHTPDPSDKGYVLAGHVHPAVRLRGKGAQSLRLPCFHFTTQVATLPAFSSLANGAEIRPKRGDRVYVVANGEVMEAAS